MTLQRPRLSRARGLVRIRGWRRRTGAAVLLSLAALLTLVWTPRTVRAAMRSFVTSTSIRAHRGTLIAQTLNVFGLPWPVGHDVATRCARTAACIAEATPDFVVLQEVWDEDSRQPLFVPGYHAVFSESQHGLLGQNGLLTLSRHTVLDATSYRFASAEGLEAWVSKGALRTLVSLPDGTSLAVWNVHLQSGAQGRTVRDEQIRELVGWIRAAGDSHKIALGDFNCGPGDPEWTSLQREFQGMGLVERCITGPTYDHRVNPLAAVEPPATVDHVFVDVVLHKEAAPARRIHDRPIDGVFLSDHFGLEVCLPYVSCAARR